jgi:hypothetical protein
VVAVARELGAAVIDRTPAPPPTAALASTFLTTGIRAYDALAFDAAFEALEQARDVCDRTGAAGLSPGQLADLFIYRALVRVQRSDVTAWDELVTSAVVDPTRVLDKARFPPKVVEDVARAQTEVLARPRGTLAIAVPAGCTATVDGRAVDPSVKQIVGPHWVHVQCVDRAPWGSQVLVTEANTQIAPQLAPLEHPSDTEMLVQARTAGARGLIVAEVRGQIGTARLLGLDGRERGRRTVTIHGDLRPLADAIRQLGQPTSTPQPWYRSKWAWAAGAALLAAAVVVPITAVVAGSGGERTGTIGGPP